MEKEKWKDEIIKACKDAGTYQTYFEAVIDTLAKVLEERDKADEQYAQSGSNPTIIHVNRAKEKNVTKNPILVMRNELNTQALALWRELGLTPKGLRTLTADVVERSTSGGLEKLLAKLDG